MIISLNLSKSIKHRQINQTSFQKSSAIPPPLPNAANGRSACSNLIMDDIDVEYDSSKLRLKWYVDGVEDPSLENQTQVTFDRPSNNSVKVYTWRVDDLTGTVSAPDDVTDIDDFYEGLFNSDFYWYDYESEQWGYKPSDRTQYD